MTKLILKEYEASSAKQLILLSGANDIAAEVSSVKNLNFFIVVPPLYIDVFFLKDVFANTKGGFLCPFTY